jgi:hypothetical protein
MRALEEIPQRWLRWYFILNGCLAIHSSSQGPANKLVVINIIEDENPFSDRLVQQPVPDELKNICVTLLPSGNFGSTGDVSKTLLAAGRVTSIYPEDPCSG